jgi:signal transduction histidine kinase
VRGIRDLPAITGDFQRLVQVVSNLGYNALKYTPDGGRVTISAEVLKDDEGDASEIELVFADTGVGIDPRNHELVFEKFFRAYDPQLHSTGNTKFMGAGPGLGLSIVRGIVEAHGGRIWVESPGYDPDRCPGSEFHVVLPIKASLPEVSAVAA